MGNNLNEIIEAVNEIGQWVQDVGAAVLALLKKLVKRTWRDYEAD